MRRNLWLIGFGMVNAFILLWYGDILYAYGVTALFLFPFRKLAPKWLIAIGSRPHRRRGCGTATTRGLRSASIDAYAAARRARATRHRR